MLRGNLKAPYKTNDGVYNRDLVKTLAHCITQGSGEKFLSNINVNNWYVLI